MRKTFQKSLGLLLSITVLLSLVTVPSAYADQTVVKGRYTVQEWKFQEEYAAEYLNKDQVTFLNGDEIAIANKGWHDDTAAPTARTIQDGVLKIEVKTSSNYTGSNAYYSTTNLAFRLDRTLKSGQEYTLNLGIYSPDKIWAHKAWIMYSDKATLNTVGFTPYIANKAGPSVDSENNFGCFEGGPAKKLVVEQIGTLPVDETNVHGFKFTPAEDIAAGNYIRVALNTRNITANSVKTIYVTSLALESDGAVPSDLLKKDADGNFKIQSWVFDQPFSDAETAADKVSVINSKSDLYLGYKYWHDDHNSPIVRTVENGVLKLALGTNSSSTTYFSTTNLALKLDQTLCAGVEYTLELGMYGDLRTNGSTAWSNNTWIMTSTADTLTTAKFTNYVANASSPPSVDAAKNFGCTADGPAKELVHRQIGRLPTENTVHSFTFTPEADIPANDVIRVALNFQTSTTAANVYVTSLALKASADEWVDEYFFTDEGSRERVYASAETGSNTGAYKRSGNNFVLQLQDFALEGNAEYTAVLQAAANVSGCYISAYAFPEKPDDYVPKDGNDKYFNHLENGVLLDKDMAMVPVFSDAAQRGTVKATFKTAGIDLDFNEYKYLVFYINNVYDAGGAVNWNHIIYVDALTVYKTIPGIADFARTPTVENSYYNRIKMADDKFATYYLKSEDGSYQAAEGNVITGLKEDTVYTVVAKWADDGRYCASEDYSDEVTVKTPKYGDVNRDEEVDILDFVRMDNDLSSHSSDEIYDLNDDNNENDVDLACLRSRLLGVRD